MIGTPDGAALDSRQLPGPHVPGECRQDFDIEPLRRHHVVGRQNSPHPMAELVAEQKIDAAPGSRTSIRHLAADLAHDLGSARGDPHRFERGNLVQPLRHGRQRQLRPADGRISMAWRPAWRNDR